MNFYFEFEVNLKYSFSVLDNIFSFQSKLNNFVELLVADWFGDKLVHARINGFSLEVCFQVCCAAANVSFELVLNKRVIFEELVNGFSNHRTIHDRHAIV